MLSASPSQILNIMPLGDKASYPEKQHLCCPPITVCGRFVLGPWNEKREEEERKEREERKRERRENLTWALLCGVLTGAYPHLAAHLPCLGTLRPCGTCIFGVRGDGTVYRWAVNHFPRYRRTGR
jgi:hypothetical protein